MGRRDLRHGIAQFFGGTTYDEQEFIYRPTPLAASGLAGVRPYWTARFQDPDYLETLPQGTTMGAVMAVHIPDQDEGRYAMGGPVSGVKEDLDQVELYLLHYSTGARQELAQAQLDDLLDAVKAKIRGDRTLGGCCVEAGEGGSRLRTQADPPVTMSNNIVRQQALISFRADIYLSA